MAKFLVASKHNVVKEYMEGLFARRKHSVVGIRAAHQMTRAVFEHKPDLVIMDHSIHGATAHQLVRWMRRSPICRTLPVLMAYVPTKEKFMALENGADLVLSIDEMEASNIVARVATLLNSPTGWTQEDPAQFREDMGMLALSWKLRSYGRLGKLIGEKTLGARSPVEPLLNSSQVDCSKQSKPVSNGR